MATKHEQSQQPPKIPLSKTRRSVLKKMLMGTGVAAGTAVLPDKWAKPVVDKVLVPAHAQTSQDPCSYFVYCGFAVVDQSIQLEIWGEFNCPDGVQPPQGPEGVMVDITTVSSNPTNWPCPGNTSVALNSNGDAFVPVYPCEDLPLPTQLTVQVKFQDQVRWGTDSSTCPYPPSEPSDVRLKTDVYPLSITKEGFKLYRFRYKNDPSGKAYVGVMAQDLTDTHPDALVKNTKGYFAVRYDRLGLKMTTYREWQQSGLRAVELIH